MTSDEFAKMDVGDHIVVLGRVHEPVEGTLQSNGSATARFPVVIADYINPPPPQEVSPQTLPEDAAQTELQTPIVAVPATQSAPTPSSSQEMSSAPAAVPAPENEATTASLVQQYYQLWNNHRLPDAYQLLSLRYRATHPYPQWEVSHRAVATISVATSPTNNPLIVGVIVNSVDQTVSSSTVKSEYQGTWTAVQEGGTLKLDAVDLTQTH
jgi:hypothetical protein